MKNLLKIAGWSLTALIALGAAGIVWSQTGTPTIVNQPMERPFFNLFDGESNLIWIGPGIDLIAQDAVGAPTVQAATVTFDTRPYVSIQYLSDTRPTTLSVTRIEDGRTIKTSYTTGYNANLGPIVPDYGTYTVIAESSGTARVIYLHVTAPKPVPPPDYTLMLHDTANRPVGPVEPFEWFAPADYAVEARFRAGLDVRSVRFYIGGKQVNQENIAPWFMGGDYVKRTFGPGTHRIGVAWSNAGLWSRIHETELRILTPGGTPTPTPTPGPVEPDIETRLTNLEYRVQQLEGQRP